MLVYKDVADEETPTIATDSFPMTKKHDFMLTFCPDGDKQVWVQDDYVITDAQYADLEPEAQGDCEKKFNFCHANGLVEAELSKAQYSKLMKKYFKHLVTNVYPEKGPKKKAAKEAARGVFGEGGFINHVKANIGNCQFFHKDGRYEALNGEGIVVVLEWEGGSTPVYHVFECGLDPVKY